MIEEVILAVLPRNNAEFNGHQYSAVRDYETDEISLNYSCTRAEIREDVKHGMLFRFATLSLIDTKRFVKSNPTFAGDDLDAEAVLYALDPRLGGD